MVALLLQTGADVNMQTYVSYTYDLHIISVIYIDSPQVMNTQVSWCAFNSDTKFWQKKCCLSILFLSSIICFCRMAGRPSILQQKNVTWKWWTRCCRLELMRTYRMWWVERWNFATSCLPCRAVFLSDNFENFCFWFCSKICYPALIPSAVTYPHANMCFK